MVAVIGTIRCGIRRTDKMAKENFELHYSRISKMFFLLNGRKYDHGSKSAYYTGYNPLKFDGFKCEPPFKKTEYVFHRAYLCNTDIRGRFNNEDDISIDAITGKFTSESSKKTAQKVFGKNACESDVVYHIEKALKILLQQYVKNINETLTETAFF